MAPLQSAGSAVLWVSKDKGAALQKFAAEENLSFPLLTHQALAAHNAYRAFGEKSMYGKTEMSGICSTFVIDENGVLTPALHNVKATGHIASLKAKLGL